VFTQLSSASTPRPLLTRGAGAGLDRAFTHFGLAADLAEDDPVDVFAGSAVALDPALALVGGAFPDPAGALLDPLCGTPFALASPVAVPARDFEFSRSVAMSVPCGRRGKPPVPFSSY
jgi:hypothetical protein